MLPGLDLVENDEVRVGIVLRDLGEGLAMGVFEVDDEAESGVGGAAQDVRGLGDHVLRFDGLAGRAWSRRSPA